MPDSARDAGEARIRRALWWSLAVAAALGMAIAVAVVLREPTPQHGQTQEHRVVGPATAPAP